VDESLRAEIRAMDEEDQRVRAELLATGELFRGYNRRMEAVHLQNSGRLEQIVEAYGWPADWETHEAAFRIVQHSISRPDFMRRMQRLVTEPLAAAMLDDRIRSFEGRGQRFGTQFDWDEKGELNPLALDDPEGVDERRAQIGLPPLAVAVEAMRASLGEERPPDDPAGRRREADEWARSVGWR